MVDKLIPIYRKEEEYTIFYDQSLKGLVRLAHNKHSILFFLSIACIAMILITILHSFVKSPDSLSLRIVILALWNAINLLAVKNYHKRYYILRSQSSISQHEKGVKEAFLKGWRQYKIERIIVIPFIPLSLVLCYIYLISGTYVFLYVFSLFVSPVMIFTFTKPFKRRRLFVNYLKDKKVVL